MGEIHATLNWLTREEGGRKELPFGPRYISEGRFLDHTEKRDIEGWSLIVDKLGDCEIQTPIWRATIRFGVEEAPHEWLVNGAKFELYEGNRLVALGQID